MKTKLKLIAALLLLSTINYQPSTWAQGTAFTYQGKLGVGTNAANGSYDFRFRVATDSLGNNYVGGTLLTNGVPAANGLFTVTLDFGGGVFTGTNLWLEVGVRTNGGGGYTTLMPLQTLTATPYAITAGNLSGTLPAAQLSGTYGNAVTFNNAANSFTGNGTGLTNVNAAKLGGLSASNFWKLGGNAGANPTNGAFLGTTDNLPLEFKVNGERALRLEPNPGYGTVNIIGGSFSNLVDAGVVGATIHGGGATNYFSTVYPNRVSADFGTVGGGVGNTSSGHTATVGGGNGNTASEYNATVGGGYHNNSSDSGATVGGGYENTAKSFATVGGGYFNNASGGYATVGGGSGSTASGSDATVGGGGQNTASGYAATVGGGDFNIGSGDIAAVGGGGHNTASSHSATVGGGAYNTASGIGAFVGGGGHDDISYSGNTASGPASTVAGGFGNTANGTYATVPGGDRNVATNNSFAAGHRAKANHTGSFVWADSTEADFATSADKQFLIRASGGVGIGTTNPLALLNVNGNARVDADNSVGYGEGLSLNFPTDMPAGGYGGIHFHNAARGGNYDGGTIKWSIFYNSTPDPGAYGKGLAFVQNNVNTRLYLGTNGNVGIGTTSPTYQLQLSTDSAAKPGGGSWANSSDARLKKNIQPLTGALEKLTQLRGVRFEWVNPQDHANQHGPQGGFIAQEVEQTFPHWVTSVAAAEHDKSLTDDGKIKSLTLPFEFDALVVEAIKEQQQQIKARDAEIGELKRKNAAMETRLDAMEKRLAFQLSAKEN